LNKEMDDLRETIGQPRIGWPDLKGHCGKIPCLRRDLRRCETSCGSTEDGFD